MRRALIAAGLLAALVGALMASGSARAGSIGDDGADISAWYEGLMQPDADIGCCGRADSYYADTTDACRPNEGIDGDCAFVAIITDNRPDHRTLADGRILVRIHLDNGTRIAVPRKKVRHPPIPNPTDHNVIFVNTNEWGHYAICWEPVAGL